MNTCCPICNSDEHRLIYQQVSLDPSTDVVQCKKCNHYYSFIKDDIDTEAIYKDAVYEVVENRKSIFDKILTNEYNKVLRHLAGIQSKKGRLLDFGSGKGKLAHLAEEQGWEVKCVETSKARAQYASTVYGLDVNTAYYSTGNIFNTNFDTLTLFHVVEHLPRPAVLLNELIKHNLLPDAVIVIEVPNFNSYQSGMAKEKWLHLDIPRHLNHFSPQRLEIFVNELGLSIVKKSFFSFHLGVLGMLDSLMKKFGYRGNLIYQLKNKKSFFLLLSIGLLLPFALILESIAAFNGKGGIIRYYLRRKNSHPA